MGRHSLVAGSPAVDFGLWGTARPAMSCASTSYNSGNECLANKESDLGDGSDNDCPLGMAGMRRSNSWIRLVKPVVLCQVMVLFRRQPCP